MHVKYDKAVLSIKLHQVVFSQAWKNWQQESASDIIDPTLKNSSESAREIIRCIHIGLLCVQENVAERPTMASVVLMLNTFSLALALPSQPAFLSRSGSGSRVSERSSQALDHSMDLASITELHPR